jgi:hypothetical protein
MRTAGVPDLREQLGDTFTYGEAKQAGVGDRRLYALRDSGETISLGGGVYRWADAPPGDSDLIEIAERSTPFRPPSTSPSPEEALAQRSRRRLASTSSTPAPSTWGAQS